MDPLTVDTSAEALQEPKRTLLAQVLRTLGMDRTTAVLAETLQREALRAAHNRQAPRFAGAL